jgi:DNA-binding MarR family transcriptional regulator
MKELEEKLGRKVSTSQVYPFLQTLENNKLIKVEKKEARDKKIYSLTKEGKNFVDSILSRFGDLIHVAIEPRLSVCAHCGCKVYEGGYKEKIGKKELIFCCKYCAESFKARH